MGPCRWVPPVTLFEVPHEVGRNESAAMSLAEATATTDPAATALLTALMTAARAVDLAMSDNDTSATQRASVLRVYNESLAAVLEHVPAPTDDNANDAFDNLARHLRTALHDNA